MKDSPRVQSIVRPCPGPRHGPVGTAHVTAELLRQRRLVRSRPRIAEAWARSGISENRQKARVSAAIAVVIEAAGTAASGSQRHRPARAWTALAVAEAIRFLLSDLPLSRHARLEVCERLAVSGVAPHEVPVPRSAAPAPVGVALDSEQRRRLADGSGRLLAMMHAPGTQPWDAWLTAAEVAEIVKVQTQDVEAWLDAGLLDCVRLPTASGEVVRRILPRHLDAFAQRVERTPRPDAEEGTRPVPERPGKDVGTAAAGRTTSTPPRLHRKGRGAPATPSSRPIRRARQRGRKPE